MIFVYNMKVLRIPKNDEKIYVMKKVLLILSLFISTLANTDVMSQELNKISENNKLYEF